jgi:hypothetical protein
MEENVYVSFVMLVRFCLETMMTDDEQSDDENMLESLSGVSLFTGEGFVTLMWNKQRGQLDPNEARQLALNILATADAAESDAAVFAELTGKVGLTKDDAGLFIVSLRERRGE